MMDTHADLVAAVVLVAVTVASAVRTPLAGGATSVIGMADTGIVYSPYNWGQVGAAPSLAQTTKTQAGVKGVKTINPGAYFRTIFSGQSLTLHTDTSLNTEGPFSQFWTKVDGGPLIAHTLSPGNPTFEVDLCNPTCTASPFHLLEVIVKSTTETISRWSPQTTSLTFTGIEVAAGTNLTAPRRKPYSILIYGDSITEGVRTMGYVGIQNDTDRNDAVRDYSFQLSKELPAEVGVVAFGATGINKGGSGGVPSFPSSWNFLWEGEPRDFATSPPDLVVYNEGTNDGGNITANFVDVLTAFQKVSPKSKHLLLLPFNGGHRADLEAVIAAVASPLVTFGDTTGFYDGADGLHPFGYNHIGNISPKMAELCAPLLTGKASNV